MATAAMARITTLEFPRPELCPPQPVALPDPSLEATFEAIVARYGPKLYRIALRQLGNPDDAQDAVQEALLLAFRHLDQFQGRSEMATWLTRIVINSARGLRRKSLARPAASLDECALSGLQFPDPRPTPEDHCAQSERRQRLERMLSRLSPALRLAVQLCELEGLSCRQAAERLGLKPATLKCRVFRARARLATLAHAA